MTALTTDNPVALEKLKIRTLILPIIDLSHKNVFKICDIETFKYTQCHDKLRCKNYIC